MNGCRPGELVLKQPPLRGAHDVRGNQGTERSARKPRETAQGHGAADFRGAASSIEMAEELTKILIAIEALDRTLNEAGHPYMSQGVVEQLRAGG